MTSDVVDFKWLDGLKPKDFFIILDIRVAHQSDFEKKLNLEKIFIISISVSEKNFEECGLSADIKFIHTFRVTSFKDNGLIEYINNIIQSNPYKNIIIVGDKHFDIKGTPRFGFRGEFHNKVPTAEKLALELEHHYL